MGYYGIVSSHNYDGPSFGFSLGGNNRLPSITLTFRI